MQAWMHKLKEKWQLTLGLLARLGKITRLLL